MKIRLRRCHVATLLVVGLLTIPLLAAEGSSGSPAIGWPRLISSLLGGLALFLYGMEQMAGGLKAAAGSRVKDILARFTSNRVKGAITGALVTAIIQSSSVTTVLTVGFVSAGIMSLTQSVGIILGANVGSTLTAQVVAFKVEDAALGMIAIGFLLLFVSKRDPIKQLGNIVMGLGLVFFGMGVMSGAMNPLRSYPPFIDLMTEMSNPALGILAGAAFTALVQSSSATTGVTIALASQGLIQLPAGIALIFGANIGTCVTAFLATLGKSREARQVAIVHILFNILGVLIWIGLIPQLANWVTELSPSYGDLEGTDRLAREVPRQVANAHAVFNLTNTLLLLPFAPLLAKIARKLAPSRADEPSAAIARHLDRNAFEVPALALANARRETTRLAELVSGMLNRFLGRSPHNELELESKLASSEKTVNALNGEILRYLSDLNTEDFTQKESRSHRALLIATDTLEGIADIVAHDLLSIRSRIHESSLDVSETMADLAQSLCDEVADSLEKTVNVISDDDADLASEVLGRRAFIDQQVKKTYRHHETRFRDSSSDRIDKFRLEMTFIHEMRNIYTLTQRVATTALPAATEDRDF
ncbi:MAG: Na/Pi cotransporter family protein [Verrucomicrobiota bacterium]